METDNRRIKGRHPINVPLPPLCKEPTVTPISVPPLDDAAAACRILSAEGHSDLTLGHLSWRDPDGRGLWMKRSGIGLGEVAGPDDFILLDFDGRRIAGEGPVHKEWPIHTEVLRARPDIVAVGHSHPPHASAFSALDAELEPVTNEAVYLGRRVPRFDETRGLIDTPSLGRALARSLGTASAVLMRNHGILFVGSSIAEATLTGIFLERACRTQLMLMATGRPWQATPADSLSAKQGQILDATLLHSFWAHLRRTSDPGRRRSTAIV